MRTFAILSSLVFVASCSGQVKTDLSKNSEREQKKFWFGQPKLIKTQGSGLYDNVHCGLEDKAGVLWFGTTGEGVYRYDGKSFTQFTTKDGLNSNKVWSILEDKLGNIWFGTDAGVCRYDGNVITKVPMTEANFNTFYNNPIAKNAVWSMLQDKKGKIWFGTDEGVYSYNGKTFARFLDNKDIKNDSGLSLKSVQCMLEDKNGNVWFGSGPMAFEGIGFYDGKSLTKYRPNNESWIRKIIEDKNGNLLFATRRFGVFFYNLSDDKTNKKTFRNFSKPPDLINNSLNDILKDKAGNIWFASDYGKYIGDTLGGVWRSNVSAEKTNEQPFIKLSTIEAFFMLEDSARNIWVGTRNTGLYRFNGKTFTSFSEY